MSEFPNIINWENIFSKSEEFDNSKDPKFTFVENWIENDFYEKLYKRAGPGPGPRPQSPFS